MVTFIESILARRKLESSYDEQMWNFVGDINNRPLQNISDSSLQLRLAQLEKNIQYLDVEHSGRDKLRAEHGWLSPWWWLRLRHWTLNEMAKRSIAALPSMEFRPARPLRSEFTGLHGGGTLKLFRISQKKHLIEMIKKGKLRFTPASDYRDIEDDEARSDNELRKSFRTPSQNVTITHQSGQLMRAIGDVVHSVTRMSDDQKSEIPYWLICFSTDLDPRLFNDFPSAEGDDAVLAIFDVQQFLQRALSALSHVAPYFEKSLLQVTYFDPYNRPTNQLSALDAKEFQFSYQREIRMLLDPVSEWQSAEVDPFFVEIGSLIDIAAIYSPDGTRIAGSGPKSFFV